jgi:hypothetical protein
MAESPPSRQSIHRSRVIGAPSGTTRLQSRGYYALRYWTWGQRNFGLRKTVLT